MKCLYELLLVLIVLYILGSVLENVLYKDIPENAQKKFKAKWWTIVVGLAVAWGGAYFMQEWCLLLPLLIAIIASLAWLLTHSRHNSLRASAKSWYLVGSARAKSAMKSGQNSSATSPAPGTTIIIPEKK